MVRAVVTARSFVARRVGAAEIHRTAHEQFPAEITSISRCGHTALNGSWATGGFAPVEAFGRALDGETCHVVDARGRHVELPTGQWLGPADEADHVLMLDHCTGPTLDVGCGPGRLLAALASTGVPAMGIDVSPRAVHHARSRGAQAVQTDVFGLVPGQGQWTSALLADGNVGIGGDPVRLMGRIAELMAAGSSLLVEVTPPSSRSTRQRLRLRVAGRTTDEFWWSTLSAADVGDAAQACGWRLHELRDHHGRWVAELRLASPRPEWESMSA